MFYMKPSGHNDHILKERSGQYSVLMQIQIVTGNEKLCKVYFKKLFFQNVSAFIDFFIDINTPTISSIQTVCDVMCVQYVIRNFYIVYSKKIF